MDIPFVFFVALCLSFGSCLRLGLHKLTQNEAHNGIVKLIYKDSNGRFGFSFCVVYLLAPFKMELSVFLLVFIHFQEDVPIILDKIFAQFRNRSVCTELFQLLIENCSVFFVKKYCRKCNTLLIWYLL